MTSFYPQDELESLGLASYGENVRISRSVQIYNPAAIAIADHVRIDDFCILSGGSGISIGNYVHIGCFSSLFGGAGIQIMDYAGLSTRVAIFSESDDISGRSMCNPTIPLDFKPRYRRGKVVLERFSGIATNSTVFPGVRLGEGAVLMAHSYAIRSLLPWMLYTGTPAKILRPRHKDLIDLEKRFHEQRRINMQSFELFSR